MKWKNRETNGKCKYNSHLQFYTIEIPRNGANSIDSTDYKVKNKKGK